MLYEVITARQNNSPGGTSEKVELTHEEKEKILEKINEERRIAHKYKESYNFV